MVDSEKMNAEGVSKEARLLFVRGHIPEALKLLESSIGEVEVSTEEKARVLPLRILYAKLLIKVGFLM